MSDASLSPARLSGPALTLMYLAYLIGGLVFLVAVTWVAEVFFHFDLQSGAMGIILPMAAAMGVGGVWFQKEGGRPASGRAWRMAAVWTWITLALQAALVWLAWRSGALEPLIGPGGPRDEDLRLFAIVFAGLAVLELLVMRLGLWAAFRGAAKRASRKR